MDVVTGEALPPSTGHGLPHDHVSSPIAQAAPNHDKPATATASDMADVAPALPALPAPNASPIETSDAPSPDAAKAPAPDASTAIVPAVAALSPSALASLRAALDARDNPGPPKPELGFPDDDVEMAVGPITSGMAQECEFPPPEPQQRLSAFARLRFSDGSYYMHTYQIILGRNVELAHRDMRRLKKAEMLRQEGKFEAANAILQGKKRRKTVQRPRSVISQTGGIVSAPMSAMPIDYQQRRQSVASHSLSSSSHRQGESSQEEHIDQAPQDVIMQAFDEVPDQLESFVPEDPKDCPLVPIHPQHITAMTGVRGPKGISREHAKIQYNFDKGTFEIEVLSSNGLYHEDKLYRAGEVVELNHGDTIVIGMVDMTFFLPDIALTDEQRVQHDAGSRPMSFSFENGQGEVESDELMDENSASEEASVNPRHLFHMPVSHYDSEEELLAESDDDMDEDIPSSPEPKRKKQAMKQKLKLKLNNKASRVQMPPPKKESKSAHKRKLKQMRETTPEEPVPVKRVKTKPKEAEKEPPKEKGKAPVKAAPTKAPAKIPAKSPAKELPQEKAEKKPEPAKTPKSESPSLARRPTFENGGSGDEGEQEGTLTAEMVKRHGLPDSLIGMIMEKRKGPGRPPKDGVMSKRQRAQLVKQGKEIEKARAAGIDPADLPMPTVKPKVARPRKDSNAAGDGDDDDVRETTEKGDGTGGDKKQSKPNRPPRTPSPEMKIEDYTEEQLQRPSANYVVLIHEAISSSKTGQMNLQQIYNYIERKYPWYKFKTTTSGWQSSVRHNLGQHDAFVKGDKEGKGFNWRINPEVSIEKERRKRQVSPQVGHPQRPGYYPPPNGYPPYGHPGPYYPGMPAPGAMNGAPPPGPPNVETVQPRLPPSLARNAAATPATPGAPNPSPYSSPWAGGNTASHPPNQNHPRPFPQSTSQPPPSHPAPAPSGQYGVLYPTSAPQPVYGNYATSGPYAGQPPSAAPYSNAPRPYTPYATAGPTPHVPQAPPQQAAPPRPVQVESRTLHPSGRYPLSTNPALIHQLEAFRDVYLQKTPLEKAAEEKKVDNVIRALVNPEASITLAPQEQELFEVITKIATVRNLGVGEPRKDGGVVKQENEGDAKPNITQDPSNSVATNSEVPKTDAASTAAAIAASDAAVAASGIPPPTITPSTNATPAQSAAPPTTASTAAPYTSPFPPAAATATSTETEPHKFTPNMGGPRPTSFSPPTSFSTTIPRAPMRIHTSRPSVEPLTPVPGSPAVPNGSIQNKTTLASEIEQTDTSAGAKDEPPKKQDEPTGQADTSADVKGEPPKDEKEETSAPPKVDT